MKSFRIVLMAAGATAVAAIASSASATTLTVGNVGVQSTNTVGNVPFIGSAISTAITLQITALNGSLPNLPYVAGKGVGDTLVVFCDDLTHEVAIGGSGNHFSVGLGHHGQPAATLLIVQQSNIMGQLADLGRSVYATARPPRPSRLDRGADRDLG